MLDLYIPSMYDFAGDIEKVANTMFDLRQPVQLGDRIHKIPGDIGYDHNFCLESKGNKSSLAAV